MKRAVVLLALLVPVAAVLPACTGIPFVERICPPEECIFNGYDRYQDRLASSTPTT